MPGCSAQLTPSYLAAFSKCPRNGSKRCHFPVEEGTESLEVKVSLRAAPAELGLLPRTGPGRLVLWSVALGRKVRELQAVGLWPCAHPEASGSCLHVCLSLQPAMGSGGGGGEDPGYRHEQACMCVWGRGLGAMPAWALLQSQVGPSTPCTDPSLSSPPGSDGSSKGASLLLSQSSACVSTALSLECFVWDTCQSAVGNRNGTGFCFRFVVPGL